MAFLRADPRLGHSTMHYSHIQNLLLELPWKNVSQMCFHTSDHPNRKWL